MQRRPLADVIADLESNKLVKLELKNIGTEPVQRFNVRHDDDLSLREIYHINDEVLLELAKALEVNTSLKSFSINDGDDGNRFYVWTSAGATAIGLALMNHPALTHFCIDLRPNNNINSTNSQFKVDHITGFLDCFKGTANINHVNINVICDTDDFYNKLGQGLSCKTKLVSVEMRGRLNWTHDESFNKNIDLFMAGIAQQVNLKSFRFHQFNANSHNRKALGNALSNLAELEYLDLIPTGEWCDHQSDVAEDFRKIFSGKKLKILELKIDDLSVNSMITALSDSAYLGTLKLRCNNILAMENLCISWRKENLNIPCLFIINLVYSEHDCVAFANSISHLVDENTSLKSLILSCSRMEASHIRQMKALLSDPLRCHLNVLNFHFPAEKIVDEDILDIVNNNINIVGLVAGEGKGKAIARLDIALKTNLRKNQWKFIESVIELANIFYGESADANQRSHFGSLPNELLLIILYHFGKGALGMKDQEIRFCCELILGNFQTRRNLINQDPAKNIPAINHWWKQSLFYQVNKENKEYKMPKLCEPEKSVMVRSIENCSIQ